MAIGFMVISLLITVFQRLEQIERYLCDALWHCLVRFAGGVLPRAGGGPFEIVSKQPGVGGGFRSNDVAICCGDVH